jgi:hypothetical protein
LLTSGPGAEGLLGLRVSDGARPSDHCDCDHKRGWKRWLIPGVSAAQMTTNAFPCIACTTFRNPWVTGDNASSADHSLFPSPVRFRHESSLGLSDELPKEKPTACGLDFTRLVFFFSVCHGAGFLATLPLTPWTPSPPYHRLVRVCSNWVTWPLIASITSIWPSGESSDVPELSLTGVTYNEKQRT